MKTFNYLLIATLFAVFVVSCGNTNTPENTGSTGNANNPETNGQEQPKKGALVYYLDEEECGGAYYDGKLGADFDSALDSLIRSRDELASLGENLYVKQMEITSIQREDSSKVILLHFFEKVGDNLNMLSTAHDAIDTNGNHYDVQFCDGPVSDPEDRKPEGSYSYREDANHYLMFARNYGENFDSAYVCLKPEIEARMAYYAEHYKQAVTVNSSDMIVVLKTITVTNCEIEGVVFTMIELDMFSNIEEDYLFRENFGVLDSNGNFYYDKSLPVYDPKD